MLNDYLVLAAIGIAPSALCKIILVGIINHIRNCCETADFVRYRQLRQTKFVNTVIIVAGMVDIIATLILQVVVNVLVDA